MRKPILKTLCAVPAIVLVGRSFKRTLQCSFGHDGMTSAAD